MRPASKKNRKPEKSRTGEFRVIAGQWRSRRFSFPDLPGLRPTTDRVRETVFNWLAPYLPGAHVLDAFAGSGALGIEALSRGASHTTFVEMDPLAAQSIKTNLAALKAEQTVIQADIQTWLATFPQACRRFDLVFLDPPFRQGLLEQTVNLMQEYDVLAEDARVYIEQEKEAPVPVVPSQWSITKEKVAGQVAYYLFQRQV